MKSDVNLKVGDVVWLLGKTQAGDGTSHLRKIVTTSDTVDKILLSNGLFAEVVPNSFGVNIGEIASIKGDLCYRSFNIGLQTSYPKYANMASLYVMNKSINLGGDSDIEFICKTNENIDVYILDYQHEKKFNVLERITISPVPGYNIVKLPVKKDYSNVYLGFQGLLGYIGGQPDMYDGSFYERVTPTSVDTGVISMDKLTTIPLIFAINVITPLKSVLSRSNYMLSMYKNIGGLDHRSRNFDITYESAEVLKHLMIRLDASYIRNKSDILCVDFDLISDTPTKYGVEIFSNDSADITSIHGGSMVTTYRNFGVTDDSASVKIVIPDTKLGEYKFMKVGILVENPSRDGHFIINNLRIRSGESYLPDDAYKEIGMYKAKVPISTLLITEDKDINSLDYRISELEKKPDVALDQHNILKDFPILRYSLDAANIDNTLLQNAYFIGRWFSKNIDGVDCTVTINQGSECYFKVSNTTKATINIKNFNGVLTPYISYIIDDRDQVRVSATGDIQIDMPDLGEHYVRIISEGILEGADLWNGEKGLALSGISVDSGGHISPVKPLNKKIYFYGDSITAGINVLGTGANPTVNSGGQSYPFHTARCLNAVTIRCGFGASGMTRGGSGGVPKCPTYIDQMTSTRLENINIPDIICINHGTNDHGATDEVFKTEYQSALSRLKIKYPGVPIFCIVPFNQTKRTAIVELVGINKNCHLVETIGWGVTYSDGTHPDLNGSILAGEKLASHIVNTIGKTYFI